MRVTAAFPPRVVKMIVIAAMQGQWVKNGKTGPMEPSMQDLMLMNLDWRTTDDGGLEFVFSKKGHKLGDKQIVMPFVQ